MKTLHLAAGDAGAGSVVLALEGTGREEEVLGCVDDLSCGPIDSDDPRAREAWWGEWWEPKEGNILRRMQSFWNRVTTGDERLVVWFGRHSATEHAFFLALADRLGDKHYDIVDVTGAMCSTTLRNGTPGPDRPAQAVATTPRKALRHLISAARPANADEKRQASERWRLLKRENAPFRIVTDTGMASASLTHFDASILGCASAEWQKIARVIGNALGRNCEPYMQVSDGTLLARAVDLVGSGLLLAEGDPWDMHSCRVRLPEAA